MIFIKHRVNKIRDLKKLNKEYGVEIDIRSNGKNLYLHHDPYKKVRALLNGSDIIIIMLLFLT